MHEWEVFCFFILGSCLFSWHASRIPVVGCRGGAGCPQHCLGAGFSRGWGLQKLSVSIPCAEMLLSFLMAELFLVWDALGLLALVENRHCSDLPKFA